MEKGERPRPPQEVPTQLETPMNYESAFSLEQPFQSFDIMEATPMLIQEEAALPCSSFDR
jgi:hypothetical protein